MLKCFTFISLLMFTVCRKDSLYAGYLLKLCRWSYHSESARDNFSFWSIELQYAGKT